MSDTLRQSRNMQHVIADRTRYSQVAIAFHWVIAALVVTNFLLAWSAEEVSEAQERVLMGYHMANGILILILSVLRVIWRITHPVPPFVPTMKRWEVVLARITHWLFYILIVAIPLSGWAMTSAASGGQPVDFFGLFGFPGLPLSRNEATAGVLHEVHEIGATMVLLLFFLHVAAALKHQFFNRDTTLARMIPWLR